MLGREVVQLGAVGGDVVQLPLAARALATSFQSPARTARLPSCSQKIASRSSGLPANAGTQALALQRRDGVAVDCFGYVAPARSTQVAMMSIRWPGCLRELALGARCPPGQWAISGVLMPPSWTQCLYSRNGVLRQFAQPRP